MADFTAETPGRGAILAFLTLQRADAAFHRLVLN
jgi:hypothetical protein